MEQLHSSATNGALLILSYVRSALFDRSIKSAAAADLKSRTDFVTSCALFDGWKPHLQRQAAMSLVRELYSFDRPIIRQGASLNRLLANALSALPS